MNKLEIVVAPGPWDAELWRHAFETKAGGRKVRVWPNDGVQLGENPYVICSWKADSQIFEQSIPPAAVFSLGAGVDHLHALEQRPEIPVARVIDPDLTMRMVEYVMFAVLYLHRKIRTYEASQARREWSPVIQPAANGVRVGIMGVGVLGKACGQLLQRIGFKVAGWARTKPSTHDFPMFAGPDELPAFLERTDILVSLLPNTVETSGLIGKSTFAGLSLSGSLDGPCFVNVGRGEVVCQHDLVEALRDGTLAGAVLDVFELEPLEKDSPLWLMPNVLVTPHVAADSDPDVVVDQILRRVKSLENGQPLTSRVNLARGY